MLKRPDMRGFESNDKTEKLKQCTCYKRYFWICGLCLATFICVIGCCFYCYCLMVQINELKRACKESLGPVLPDNNFDIDVKYTSNTDLPENRRVKRKATNSKNKKGPKKPRRKSKLKAAHYGSYVTDENIGDVISGYDDGKITKTCKYIDEMKGTLCRSKDFTTNSATNSLHLFKKAYWVNAKSDPFRLKEHGLFEAKTTGVYLVYAQIVFHSKEEHYMVTLAQRRPTRHENILVQKLTCYANGDKTKDPRYTSCGITGLFYLEKKDYLSLDNFYNVMLNLKEAGTFFGAVLLK